MNSNLPAQPAPPSQPAIPNPDLLVAQFAQVSNFCRINNIKSLTTIDGVHYSRNMRTGVETMAGSGVAITVDTYTTHLSFRNPASTGDQAMRELRTNIPSLPQRMLGAFNDGMAQSTVSKRLSRAD